MPIPANKEIKDKYSAMGLASHSPWHPYRTIPILEDVLEYYQYRHTTCPELFTTNPLTTAKSWYQLSSEATDMSILLTYIPDIDEGDFYAVSNIFLEMYTEYIKPVFMEYPNNLYTLDVSTSEYKLRRYDDIRVIRFNEALDQGS
ncbi:MAG: hypothetical protein Q9M19_01045 [Mariprofundaceae bacterium]|nr:hypothetical protein [Mariprofundaceae bacterium]